MERGNGEAVALGLGSVEGGHLEQRELLQVTRQREVTLIGGNPSAYPALSQQTAITKSAVLPGR